MIKKAKGKYSFVREHKTIKAQGDTPSEHTWVSPKNKKWPCQISILFFRFAWSSETRLNERKHRKEVKRHERDSDSDSESQRQERGFNILLEENMNHW